MKKNSRIGIGINLIAMMRLVQLYYNITHEIIVYKPQVIMAQLWFYNNSTYVVYKSYIISVNCQWSSWSGYSGCTKSCGGGTQFKTRIKTIPESDGGTCFGEKENSRNCNIQNCPGKFTEVEYMFLLTGNIMSGAENLWGLQSIFFLTVGQNNFGNKIPFLFFPLGFQFPIFPIYWSE